MVFGTFNILAFALQMILILATGYAIADAPIVQRGLRTLATKADTPARAALVVFPIVAVAAWLNWGLGLVVGALLSREIARRVKVDFAWLVAGSYSAWSVCNSGLSSSIALSQASHGNALNLVEKATGQVVPLSETVFAPFVFIPTVLVVIVMTAIFIWMHPKQEHVVAFIDAPGGEASGTASEADPHARAASSESSLSFAARAENSLLGTLFLLVLGVGYLAMTWHTKGFELDINTTILIFLLAGPGLAAHADRLCGRHPSRRPANRLDASSIPGVRRHHGNHDWHGAGVDDRQDVRGNCDACDAAGVEFLELADYHVADSERRRALGSAGAIRPARCAQACMHRFRARPWLSPWQKTSRTCCSRSGRCRLLRSREYASSA